MLLGASPVEQEDGSGGDSVEEGAPFEGEVLRGQAIGKERKIDTIVQEY